METKKENKQVKRGFTNFFGRMQDKPGTTKISPVSKTKQGKALSVKEVMAQIGNGVSTEADLFRKLPDDGQELECVKDGEDIDGTDYIDLAISKQRMAKLKEKAKKDDEETKKKIKKAAEGSDEVRKGSEENL